MPKLASKKQKEQDVPSALAPYIHLGVDLDWGSGTEATGDCVFCGKEGKFSVNTESGQWQCFRCGEHGGIYMFLHNYWRLCEDATDNYDYIMKARKIQHPDTLMAWGVCKSVLNGRWLFPAWGQDGEGKLRLSQLYTYTKTPDRWMMMPTPGNLGHGLFGLNLFDAKKEEAYIAEGPWDALRLWEAFKFVGYDDSKFYETSSQKDCLLSNANILGAASTTGIGKNQSIVLNKVLKGKTVYIWYDNDHPRKNKNTGTLTEPAGLAGTRRVANLIGSATDDIHSITWGPDGYDPSLADGLDVSDLLNEGLLSGVEFLFTRTHPVPTEWVTEGKKFSGDILTCKPCNSWKTLVHSWRKAMKWTKGLEHALASMLASVTSTNLVGDQLWLKIIGPASCGKSSLCEAISVNKKFVLPKSTIRGFHSGYSVNGTTDNSLISIVGGMTLVTKDGDTLLQSPNLSQILAEARDVYDCVSRTHYRNAMSKDYEGVRMTWLLCGTSSLRELDTSELGQRFLDCVIMEDIDEEQENDVLWRVVNKSAAQSAMEIVEGDAGSQQTPEMSEAMRLTGGYIDWLKSGTGQKMSDIEFSEEAKRVCVRIGKFVAFMRARPSKTSPEKANREFAARLVSQHTRLARCLALVLNRKSIDDEVLKRVMQIGFDTARGITFDIAKLLYETGDEGRQIKSIHMHVNGSFSEADIRGYVRFMKQIGVVELAAVRPDKWRLTPSMDDLCTRLGFGEFDV